MKKLKLIVPILLLVLGCKNPTNNDSSSSDVKTFHRPPKFVLIELNGRELEEPAYFTLKYDNTFQLETGDGTIFNYIPKQHFGEDPFCNILAEDDRTRKTATCIKTESNGDVLIMLENNENISNFRGYRL